MSAASPHRLSGMLWVKKSSKPLSSNSARVRAVLSVGWADAVHADALVAVLDRHAAGEVGLRALGDVVDGLFRMSLQAGGRDQVDDIAAPALLQELLDRFLATEP